MENIVGKKLDLIRKRFGRLLVLKEAGRGKQGQVLWECVCECGNKTIVVGKDLKHGRTKSCGCLHKEGLVKLNEQRSLNLIGLYFGRLFVLKKTTGTKFLSWLCLCTCGNKVVVVTSNLTNGSTKSCGCLQKEMLIIRNKRPVSNKTRQKMSESKKGKYYGKNNPAWKGGVSCCLYCQNWTKVLRDYIKKRDGYKCLNPDCNSKKPNQLSVHHIDYDKKNCEQENLITVCRGCNSRANFDRGWYTSWYQTILQKRYGYNYGS